uniref:Uncharacterized protein n=1 Tax=Tanacetum cinerariifolium TaxID=118510 RepID=A0A699JXI6_TANCI|nr:hypothetical protein [Tanacetum cinerariifolium]
MVRSCRYTHSSESHGSLDSSTVKEQKSNTFFPNVGSNIERDRENDPTTYRNSKVANLLIRQHGAATTDVHSVAISSRLGAVIIRFSTRLVSVAGDSEDETVSEN